MIHKAIRSILVGNALFQDIAEGRVFWMRAPDREPMPYALLSGVGTAPQELLNGKPGDDQTRLQLDLWVENLSGNVETYTQWIAAARAALEGYRGTVDGYYIHGVSFERGNDLVDRTPGGVYSFRHSMDFTVTHTNGIERG